MAKTFFEYSRTEPARTILYVIAVMTMVAQLGTLLPFITPTGQVALQLPNVIIVTAVCSWSIWTTHRNNVSGMSHSSFWLFVMWLWTALARLAFSPDPTMLLWVPMLIVAAVLGIIYIYMSGMKKGGVDE